VRTDDLRRQVKSRVDLENLIAYRAAVKNESLLPQRRAEYQKKVTEICGRFDEDAIQRGLAVDGKLVVSARVCGMCAFTDDTLRVSACSNNPKPGTACKKP